MLDFVDRLRFHPDVVEGSKRVEEAYSRSDRLHNEVDLYKGKDLELLEYLRLDKPFFSSNETIRAEDLESKLTLIPNKQFQEKHNANLVFNFDAEKGIQRAFGIPIYLPRKPFRTLLDKDMKSLATIVGNFSGYDVADVLLSHHNVVDSDGNYVMVRGGLYGVPKGTEEKSQIESFDDLITIQPEDLVLTPLRPLRMSFSLFNPYYDGRRIMQKIYERLD
ncbi:MAG: hypothetical protein LAT82_03070 [Nanoarchaeota archaeon]|nr:hypothetical protein [Nanoarchaeota archaeon]